MLMDLRPGRGLTGALTAPLLLQALADLDSIRQGGAGAGRRGVEHPTLTLALHLHARVQQAGRRHRDGEAALSGAIARRLLEQVREGTAHSGVPDAIAEAVSARELEVLLLLDEHLATDEIAKRLFISEHTVRSHVKSLLRKLEVSSRREALEALAHARAA